MAYDDAILEFLAKPENLPVALEVSRYLEKLKETLLEKFWVMFSERFVNLYKLSDYDQNWNAHSTVEGGSIKSYTKCGVIPLKASQCETPLLGVFLENNIKSSGYRFYRGVWWTDSNPTYDPIAYRDLQSKLNSLGLTNSDSRWAGYHYLGFYALGEKFLFRMGNDPQDFVKEVVQQTWDLFVELEPILSGFNQQLLE